MTPPVPLTTRFDVPLGERSYPIFIGQGLLSAPDIWLPSHLAGRRAFIVTDKTVNTLYGETLVSALSKKMSSVTVFEIEGGESSKSYSTFESGLEFLIQHGLTRQSVLFALGGGVVGDLTGFMAACALRGVDFIQIPTTLLSQVDSSVGGKTGINSPQGKNLIGAFYQPKAVVIDLATFPSLPQRERQAGYAEILKYALLGDRQFFEYLEKNAPSILAGQAETLTHAIETSCRMKAAIVGHDEREEKGQRVLLNLGHTFAHALENAAGYDGRLLHGEAVGIGIVLAARLSMRAGQFAEQDAQRIESHLKSLGMMTAIRDITPRLAATPDELLALMRKDKKTTQSGLTFVVLDCIGQASLSTTIPEHYVLDLLKESI